MITAPTDGVVAKVEQLQVGDYHCGVRAGVCLGIDPRRLDRGELQGSPARPHARRASSATVEFDRYPGRKFSARSPA